MRRRKIMQKRRLLVLNILFFASALLFYEIHSNLFFKEFAEKELEKFLPEDFRVEIENIEERYPSHFRVTDRKGTIILEVEREKGEFEIKGRVNHAKWQGIDIIGSVSAVIDAESSDFITADVIFEDMIINLVPFDKEIEASLSYDKKKEVVNIERFNIGDEIEGYGHVRLRAPYYVFIKWLAADLFLEEYYKPQNEKEKFTGTMNGNFTLKGPIKDAEFLAHVDIQNGYMGDLKFDYMIGNLNGKGGLISIYDSRIRKEDGYIILDGVIDLSKLEEGKAFEGVHFSPDKNFFVWDGWSVKKEYEDSSVKAEKFVSDDFHMNFETHTKNRPQEVEEHFLGVGHKTKF